VESVELTQQTIIDGLVVSTADLRRRNQNLVAQIKEKAEALVLLQGRGPTLADALLSADSRQTILLPELVRAIAPGVVATVRREAGMPHPMDFGTISQYNHADYLGRLSTGGEQTTGIESNMGFITTLLQSVADEAHSQFSPRSVASLPVSDMPAQNKASASVLRYCMSRENMVAVTCASLLRVVDIHYRWAYGYMLALETRKLSQSERLGLVLFKSFPIPSGTTLINELTRQVERAQAAAVDARKQPSTICFHTFDNVPSSMGYGFPSSARGGVGSNAVLPVCCAKSTFTLVPDPRFVEELRVLQNLNKGETPMNPLRRPSNSANLTDVTLVPADYYKMTPEELALVENECKFLLEQTWTECKDDEKSALEPAEAPGAIVGAQIKCHFCGIKWPISKQKCDSFDKDTGVTTGCQERIRGPVISCTGETVFDAKIKREYLPMKLVYDPLSFSTIKKPLDFPSLFVAEPQPSDDLPFSYMHEDVHMIGAGNPGSKEYNRQVLEYFGKFGNLRGFVENGKVQNEVQLICSDGGADYMSSASGDFGEKGTQVSLGACGHEVMNMMKHLCRVAKKLGGKHLADLHGWHTEKAQDTLLGGADTHKTIDFLLEVCAKSMRQVIIKEFKDSEHYVDGATIEDLWYWCTVTVRSDSHFVNHFHFWIKTLGALSLLRKAVRSHEISCHAKYRAAQNFLLPYFFATHASKWGPLILRDIRVVDHMVTEEMRFLIKSIFRTMIQGPDFLQEQTVREIKRNMLHSKSLLAFQIGALSRAHGPSVSTALSGICGITDRQRRDRTPTKYVLDLEACVDSLIEKRTMKPDLTRNATYALGDATMLVQENHTPLALWDAGLEGIGDFIITGKFPENRLNE